ncbi:MAG: hypothetical protein V3V15_12250 [Sphingorhabdus sp.]
MTYIAIEKKPGYLLPGLILAAGFSIVFAPEAKAATQHISCPLEKIRRAVTTPLPSGWWSTPIVNRLQQARVVTIAGRKALQCNYGSAGNIQRYAPSGATCRATTAGFICRTNNILLPSRPRTHTTGPLNIRQTFLADLDSGRITQNGADIWFQAETRYRLFVTPRNGAKIAVGNRSNRGFAGCSRAHFHSGKVALSSIPVGSYVCVKTNQGRISQFRVNGLSSGSPKTLSIGYTTWKR